MSTVIQLFCFNGSEIRSIVPENGDVWFVGRDVAEILQYVDKAQALRQHCKRAKPLNLLNCVKTPYSDLEYNQTSDMIKRLDSDEKRNYPIRHENGNYINQTLINEFGMYEAILGSKNGVYYMSPLPPLNEQQLNSFGVSL